MLVYNPEKYNGFRNAQPVLVIYKEKINDSGFFCTGDLLFKIGVLTVFVVLCSGCR